MVANQTRQDMEAEKHEALEAEHEALDQAALEHEAREQEARTRSKQGSKGREKQAVPEPPGDPTHQVVQEKAPHPNGAKLKVNPESVVDWTLLTPQTDPPALPSYAELIVEELRTRSSLSQLDRSALLEQYKRLTDPATLAALSEREQRDREEHALRMKLKQAEERRREDLAEAELRSLALKHEEERVLSRQRMSFAQYQTLVRYMLGITLVGVGLWMLVVKTSAVGCYPLGLGTTLVAVASGLRLPKLPKKKKDGEEDS